MTITKKTYLQLNTFCLCICKNKCENVSQKVVRTVVSKILTIKVLRIEKNRNEKRLDS